MERTDKSWKILRIIYLSFTFAFLFFGHLTLALNPTDYETLRCCFIFAISLIIIYLIFTKTLFFKYR